MKKILFLFTVMAVLFSGMDATAQGGKIGTYDTSYALTGSDTLLKYYEPQFFGTTTKFSVGALFEKGATEDVASRLRVYSALTKEALEVSLTSGVELSATDSVYYNEEAEAFYDEATYTLQPGHWVKVILDRVGTATDTSTVKPYIIIHP